MFITIGLAAVLLLNNQLFVLKYSRPSLATVVPINWLIPGIRNNSRFKFHSRQRQTSPTNMQVATCPFATVDSSIFVETWLSSALSSQLCALREVIKVYHSVVFVFVIHSVLNSYYTELL